MLVSVLVFVAVAFAVAALVRAPRIRAAATPARAAI